MQSFWQYSKALAAALVSGLTAASAIGGAPHWLTIASAVAVPAMVAITTNAPKVASPME